VTIPIRHPDGRIWEVKSICGNGETKFAFTPSTPVGPAPLDNSGDEQP